MKLLESLILDENDYKRAKQEVKRSTLPKKSPIQTIEVKNSIAKIFITGLKILFVLFSDGFSLALLKKGTPENGLFSICIPRQQGKQIEHAVLGINIQGAAHIIIISRCDHLHQIAKDFNLWIEIFRDKRLTSVLDEFPQTGDDTYLDITGDTAKILSLGLVILNDTGSYEFIKKDRIICIEVQKDKLTPDSLPPAQA